MRVKAISSGSSGPSSKPVDEELVKGFLDGLHDQALVGTALELLSIAENYTPENFEDKQRQTLMMLTDRSRKTAEEYLPKRIADNEEWQGQNSYTPDLSSIAIEKEAFAGAVLAKVTIDGDGDFSNKDRTFPTRRIRYRVKMIVKGIDDIKVSSWTSEVL